MGFKFMAIVRNGPESSTIYRIAVDGELHEEMCRTFTIPTDKWLDPAMQRTEFNPDYKMTDTQIFEIKQFAMPPDILNAVRFPQEYAAFNADEQGVADVKGIVAVNTDGGKVTAIFKAVGKAKKVEPAKNLMLLCSRSGYTRLSRPGIILDDKIAALYEDGSLLFRSPVTVKQVLSLKDYIKELNDLEIVNFLETRFEADPEKVLAVTDPWMRKRFAALIESNLFEERTALEIYDAAKNFSGDIPMEISKDRTKLVMSPQKGDIKMVLKFLNEEYYKGVLTGKDYQTPSKRPLQNAEAQKPGQPRRQGLRF